MLQICFLHGYILFLFCCCFCFVFLNFTFCLTLKLFVERFFFSLSPGQNGVFFQCPQVNAWYFWYCKKWNKVLPSNHFSLVGIGFYGAFRILFTSRDLFLLLQKVMKDQITSGFVICGHLKSWTYLCVMILERIPSPFPLQLSDHMVHIPDNIPESNNSSNFSSGHPRCLIQISRAENGHQC